jgi:Bardet-Biedl syndrome 7 protein
LLQSDVSVELMDVERNSAVVSLSTPEPGSGNSLLAVYRCQADTTRMEMRIRSIEGQYGTLRVYITPRILPKMCQMRSYPIKPLALHERIHDFDVTRPLNTLTLTGTFSVTEAHSWLVLCVSQIPERCPQQDTVTYNFQSSFNGGTMLQAVYARGKAVYRSDNLSTIVILRDVISRVASSRQIKIHINCEISQESIVHTLKLIHPKMEQQTNLVKHLELAKGLKDLEDSFEDISYLNPELRDILSRHESLHKEAEKKSIYFDRLLGIITDLYIDKYKMLGQNVKHKANDLLHLLNDEYSLDTLLQFFDSPP